MTHRHSSEATRARIWRQVRLRGLFELTALVAMLLAMQADGDVWIGPRVRSDHVLFGGLAMVLMGLRRGHAAPKRTLACSVAAMVVFGAGLGLVHVAKPDALRPRLHHVSCRVGLPWAWYTYEHDVVAVRQPKKTDGRAAFLVVRDVRRGFNFGHLAMCAMLAMIPVYLGYQPVFARLRRRMAAIRVALPIPNMRTCVILATVSVACGVCSAAPSHFGWLGMAASVGVVPAVACSLSNSMHTNAIVACSSLMAALGVEWGRRIGVEWCYIATRSGIFDRPMNWILVAELCLLHAMAIWLWRGRVAIPKHT